MSVCVYVQVPTEARWECQRTPNHQPTSPAQVTIFLHKYQFEHRKNVLYLSADLKPL